MCVFTNKFHERLRELRRKNKLSRKDVALAVGISQAELSRWEAGFQIPQVNSAKKLAEFYNVSLEYLLGQKDE